MTAFAAEHGNRLHARVVSLLRESAWHVLVSPYYRDNATDKAREADIIAEREFPVHNMFNNYAGCIRLRLIIECKYLSEETLCWFDVKDTQRTIDLIVSNTPLKPPNEHIGMDSHHWYSTSAVAKLFASKPKGTGRGKEPEQEALFSAFDKVLNSLLYYRSVPTIIPKQKRLVQPLLPRAITLPLVILNDFSKLYKTTIAKPDSVVSLEGVSSFVAEINYAYIGFHGGVRVNQTEYFLADVVPFPAMLEYLALVGGAELNSMKALLGQG